MNLLITICARGGSKGIPGKNIKLLNGKPLIEYTISSALDFAKKYNSKVALSTDDENILSICNSLGLHTKYKRPLELSTDNTGKIDTINDLLLFEEKEEKTDPEPTGKSTPHVDLGTTILHAYRNLTPEQIGGMRKDTKELMELQKELMGTLAEMKPAIEQGAELLGTFSQFFGKPQ